MGRRPGRGACARRPASCAPSAVGAKKASCPALGGDDFDTLFVTTAQEGYDADGLAGDPLAGQVFIAPAAPGAPVRSGRDTTGSRQLQADCDPVRPV